MKTDLGPQYQLGESFILLLSNRKLNTDGRMCRSSDRQETDNRYQTAVLNYGAPQDRHSSFGCRQGKRMHFQSTFEYANPD